MNKVELTEAIAENDRQWEYLSKWFKRNEGKFYCGQFTDKEIAYSGFLAGIEYQKKKEESIKSTLT